MKYLIAVVVLLSALALLLAIMLVLRSRKQGGDGQEWSMKYLWAVPLILVGAALVALFYHGIPSMSSLSLRSPSVATVVDAARNYWLWTVLVLAALFFWFGSVTKPWAKGAKGMVIIVAVVLVGAMIVHGIWGGSSSLLTNHGCPHYSSLADHGCTITEKPIILVTEEVTREGESELCYLKPESAVLLTRKVGVNSFEFRSANGVFPIRYKLIRRTDMVNGECPKKF